MNYVAGVGVLVCRRPDRAFSLMVALVERLLPTGLYAHDMAARQAGRAPSVSVPPPSLPFPRSFPWLLLLPALFLCCLPVSR
jgi:hypothetical protein